MGSEDGWTHGINRQEKYAIKIATIYECAPSYVCECETASLEPSLLDTDVTVTSEIARGRETKLKNIIEELSAASLEENPGIGIIPGTSGYEIRIKVEKVKA